MCSRERNRIVTLSRLLLGLAVGSAAGCTAIADVSDYRFGVCEAGTERCRCTEDDTCDEGLECRLPGLCVDPDRPDGQAAAGGSAPGEEAN